MYTKDRFKTVNGGTLVELHNGSYGFEVEMLGENFSDHSIKCVVKYFKDADNIGEKNALVLWLDRESNTFKMIIYKFKHRESLEHYYSRKYEVGGMGTNSKIPKKYLQHLDDCILAYKIVR